MELLYAASDQLNGLLGPVPSSSQREAQTIGFSRDISKLYKRKRENARIEEDNLTEQLMNQPSAHLRTNSESGSILGFLSSSAPIAPRCASCSTSLSGMLAEKKIQCFLCDRDHCTKCVSMLSSSVLSGGYSEEIPRAGQEETFWACKRCEIVCTKQETKRQFKEVVKSAKGSSLYIVYQKLGELKEAVDVFFPEYDMLVGEFILNSDDNLDPFLNPKSVELSSAASLSAEKEGFASKYQRAQQLQAKLAVLLKNFQLCLKQIDQVAVRKTTEKKVLVFMKLALTEYAHDVIPKFNYYKLTMSHIQISNATQLYLVIYQLVWEAKSNKGFWQKNSAALLPCLNNVRAELQEVSRLAGVEWKEHKQRLEDFLVSWEKYNAYLLKGSAADQATVTLVRKTAGIVTKAMKQIDDGISADQLPSTKSALKELWRQLSEQQRV